MLCTGGLAEFATVSNDSELVVARDSGHLVYMDEPALVVESVRRVHTAIRERARLSAREAWRV